MRTTAALRRVRSLVTVLGMAAFALVHAANPARAAENDPPHRCAAYSAERRPLFGDLHVHTALSFDANSLGVRNLPTDAYRFAKGEEIGLQPYEDGKALRRTKLERPLDFAAVTDHSELLGELHMCRTMGSPGYDSLVCRVQRRWPLLAYIFVSSRMLNSVDPERYGFCGRQGELCRAASTGPWRIIRDAAEGAYDRTDSCSFSSFVAYEWSGGPGGDMTHRNVIFADEKAPDLPVSFLDESTGPDLWKRLDAECATKGCRFVTIPHNTNLSNGVLFHAETGSADDARRRREVEPLIEVIQHKGDSECRAGEADEACSFEKLPFSRMEEQPFRFRWKQPAPLSFVREILADGLRREAALGVNPFRLGMIGATDTHLAAAGDTPEAGYPGHGAGGDTSRLEVPVVPDSVWFNPGGLAGVWAEENSREAIWSAIQRREVWSTSGPRIVVRFFGGYSYPATMCSSEDFVARGYADGVAMGGELPHPSYPEAKPVFAVSAWQDAGTTNSPGTALDRVQIVKIWLTGGQVHEKVFDVIAAGGEQAGSDLDPSTCAAPKKGAPSLCATWTDTDYDPASSALYYARVLEKPSCRWTGHLCAEHHIDCAQPGSVPDEFEFCCSKDVPRTVEERALTSPIWIPYPGA